MKLQHLTVIFVIIVLPVTLILSAYTSSQIDILTLQNQYDTALIDATYDGIKAFEINESYNDLYNVADTLREDANAAIQAFMQSLATSMGKSGFKKEELNGYVPAILFTLYDGYYIYSSTRIVDELTGEEKYEYMLKPYNYYTVRYIHGNIDVVVNYSLDNYMVVYGWIGSTYYVKSGYLINNQKTVEASETISKMVPVMSTRDSNSTVHTELRTVTENKYNPGYVDEQKQSNPDFTDDRYEYLYPRNDNFYIDPQSASKYNSESTDFTKWVKNNLSTIRACDAYRDGSQIEEFKDDNTLIFNFTNNDPEDIYSPFAQHKADAIRSSILSNLKQAITNYGKASTSTYQYNLPKLEEPEWEMITTNVCMLTFLQGLPLGTKYYNNYAIVQSTTNNLYVTQDSLYYVGTNDNCYHKLDCDKLGGNITGYSNFEFELKRVKLGLDELGGEKYEYYYRIALDSNTRYTPCYYCIIGNEYKHQLDANKEKAKNTALARERYIRYKATKLLNEEI